MALYRMAFRGIPLLLLMAAPIVTTRALDAAGNVPKTQRDVAMWVLREGGRVRLDSGPEYIGDPFELPVGELHVTGVDMHGTVTDPKELAPLAGLADVRELLLPARMWSPVSDVKAPYSDEVFDFFAGLKKLERLQVGLTTLAWLDLWDAGLQRIAVLSQLKDLRIEGSTMKDPKSLAPLVNLETLDLNDTYLTDQTMTALAGMKHLRRLTMVGTLVTDEGVKYLQDLTDLEVLNLYGVKITDEGVQYLRKLTRLKELNLLGAQISDASAAILAQFKDLRELNLYRSRLTNAGLAKLQELPRLELLDLRYTGVNSAGVEAMRAARPDCKVAFVSNAPRALVARSSERPRGAGLKAIAAWVESAGGEARVSDGAIQSISLARIPFTDAQVSYLRGLTS